MKKVKVAVRQFFYRMILIVCWPCIAVSQPVSSPSGFCGGYTIDTGALNKVLLYEANMGQAGNLLPAPYAVRVFFHILKKDNGTYKSASLSQIESYFNQLSTAFSVHNICFQMMGVDSINSTLINYLEINDPQAIDTLESYLVPGCLNVFIHRDLTQGGNSAGLGYAYNAPNTYCSITTNSFFTPNVIVHEVGHCLGLYHPWEPYFGYENIDGSNSLTTGDLIFDTPADPWAYNGNACLGSSSICSYSGTCTDPAGQTNFSPLYSNLMTYCTLISFTTGQVNRMKSFLDTVQILKECRSPADSVIGPNTIVSSGKYLVSAANSITSTGNVLINGTTQAIMVANAVLLTPGFVAQSNNGARLLINPEACGFMIKPDLNESISAMMHDSLFLTVFPNPSGGKASIRYSLPHDSYVVLKIYNLQLQVVSSLVSESQKKGNHTISMPSGNYPAGIYVVSLTVPDETRSIRMVVQN